MHVTTTITEHETTSTEGDRETHVTGFLYQTMSTRPKGY